MQLPPARPLELRLCAMFQNETNAESGINGQHSAKGVLPSTAMVLLHRGGHHSRGGAGEMQEKSTRSHCALFGALSSLCCGQAGAHSCCRASEHPGKCRLSAFWTIREGRQFESVHLSLFLQPPSWGIVIIKPANVHMGIFLSA